MKITIEICNGGYVAELNGEKYPTGNLQNLMAIIRKLIKQVQETSSKVKKTPLK